MVLSIVVTWPVKVWGDGRGLKRADGRKMVDEVVYVVGIAKRSMLWWST